MPAVCVMRKESIHVITNKKDNNGECAVVIPKSVAIPFPPDPPRKIE